jgi:hypothetical protein
MTRSAGPDARLGRCPRGRWPLFAAMRRRRCRCCARELPPFVRLTQGSSFDPATSADFRSPVDRCCRRRVPDHRSRRIRCMTYDLTRLRAHGLIAREEHSHRYRVTPRGLAVAALLTKLNDRILVPALAHAPHRVAQRPDPGRRSIAQSSSYVPKLRSPPDSKPCSNAQIGAPQAGPGSTVNDIVAPNGRPSGLPARVPPDPSLLRWGQGPPSNSTETQQTP